MFITVFVSWKTREVISSASQVFDSVVVHGEEKTAQVC